MINKKSFVTTVLAGLTTAFVINWYQNRKSKGDS